MKLPVKGFQTFQPCERAGLGGFQTVRFNAKSDVLGLDQTVVALGKLIFQHIGIFAPDGVVLVLTLWNVNRLLKFLRIAALIDKGKLDADRGIKIVEEIAIAFKSLRLILVLR